MKLSITRGSTSVIFHIFILDSAQTDGRGKTALAFGDFSCRYVRSGETLSGAITAQTITTLGTYEAPTANTNIRIKLLDDTNMPGWYEVHLHNDWVNTTNSCRTLGIQLRATGAGPVNIEIELTGWNNQDGVRGGMTALPNAAADAAGGLPISDTGGLDLDAKLANTNEVTAARLSELDAATPGKMANDVTEILTDTGTTLDERIPAALTANGNMKASLVEILTTALTETVGLLAGGFKKFFNVVAPTGTANSLPDAVAGAANGLAIVGSIMGKSPATLAAGDVSGNLPATLANGAHGGAAATITLQTPIQANVASQDNIDFSALQKASLNAATPASVTGAVGSVASYGTLVADVATAVWGAAGRTLTGFGTLVADIWASVSRTLTAFAFTPTVGGYAAGQDPATLLLATPANKLATDASGRVTLVAGQLFLKKNTQVTITFPMTDAVNHAPMPGLGAGVTATRTIDGAADGACANGVTELSGGKYRLVVAASDLNGAWITFTFSAAGADTKFLTVVTQP